MKEKNKIIKSISFSAFCFILSVLMWYFLGKLFSWEGNIIQNLVFSLIFFSIFIIFTLVYLTLTDNRKIVLLTGFFTSFSFLLFFLHRESRWESMAAIICYIAITFILFVMFNLTNKNLIDERKNSIKFHSGKVMAKAVPTFMIIFAILFSATFYFNFPLMDKGGNINLEGKHLEKLEKPFADFINRYIPIFYLDMTADEFVLISAYLHLPFTQGEEELPPIIGDDKIPAEIAQYLHDQGIYDIDAANIFEVLRRDKQFRDIFISKLPPLVEDVSPYILTKYRENLSQNFTIDLKGDEKMSEVYTTYINYKVNEIPKKTRDLFLIIPALTLFGVLEIIFIILGWIYSSLAWVVFLILFKAKFFRYKKVEVEKEEIEL